MLYSLLSEYHICLKLREVDFLLLWFFFFWYFWGNALWNDFIMFNSEKCRDNSLVFVCHSVWVSGPLQLLGHYFLPGQESNGHLSNHHYTFNQLGECKYKIYKMTEVVILHFAHTYWPYHYKYGGKMLTFSITCNTTVYKLKLCWGWWWWLWCQVIQLY